MDRKTAVKILCLFMVMRGEDFKTTDQLYDSVKECLSLKSFTGEITMEDVEMIIELANKFVPLFVVQVEQVDGAEEMSYKLY